jgi:hypothetical protein
MSEEGASVEAGAVAELAGRVDGDLASPESDGWDEARQAWNLIADQQPEAVVRVTNADDVSAAINFGRESGMRVTAQALGHGAAVMGDLAGTILIRTTGLDSIEVDPDRGVAKLGAGVIWRDARNAAGEHGFTALAGSSPNVSALPYSLGGGLSWLSRHYGLSCNSIRSLDVVTADGEQRTIEAETEPDLFWAMRGGGGNFAIATAMEIDLIPLAEVYAGTMIFPPDNAAEDFRKWRDWTETVPDTVSSIARILTPPPIPDVPEPLRGRMVLTIGVCFAGDPADGPELVAPMRELGEPLMDMLGPMPPAGLCEIHMDPEPPVPGLTHSAMIRELPDDAIDTFVGEVGPGSDSPLLLGELRHVGGALSRAREGCGALGFLDAAYLMLAVGLPMAPEMAQPVNAALDSLHDAMEPWAANGDYLNFAERPTPVESLFPPDNLEHLREIKSKWDPNGVIRANHDIAV